ncbi:uncharacterized protein N7506_003198 [Penicillium brevicompactum]|uniref:uncharacterized protein n=1 Tax=Penicillium brevicompactum TaxID=5074 RepID=UPI00253F6620|nr:uncharacterized protein N7506_003198 [Penicillium brevicompactum]KAJ5343374.1 hypothetical protein N7506_003198 [Penicillium brevicompactum]
MIKVRYSVMQMILILNYLFIASSTVEDESKIRRVITMKENEWEAGFVPGHFNHMQVERWWMKTRNFLTEAGSLPNISDYQSVDPWLFDMGFVNDMLRRLQKSPLFDDDIRLDELKIVLTNLEAILSMEDERSALIQPHPIDINDTIQIQAYFATAFRALEPSILLQILPKWRKVWIRSRKNNKEDLPRLVMEPMTHDMRVQHIANIFQEVSSLNALGQETKQVKLLERSKPDRMILAEPVVVHIVQVSPNP